MTQNSGQVCPGDSATEKPPWTMPDWMELYRDLITNTGGNRIEDLVNDTAASVRNNVIRAALCIAVESQVALLQLLHRRGMLQPLVPKREPCGIQPCGGCIEDGLVPDPKEK